MDDYPGVRLMHGDEYNLWQVRRGGQYFVVVEESNSSHIWWILYQFVVDIWKLLVEFRSINSVVGTISPIHADIVDYASALSVVEPLLLVVEMSEDCWW